ncbi:MAG: cytoskeletal protein CcmA (bactofilin family), partial [Verrucomicrobiales bacterium]
MKATNSQQIFVNTEKGIIMETRRLAFIVMALGGLLLSSTLAQAATVRDDFNSASYSLSTGDFPWSTSWSTTEYIPIVYSGAAVTLGAHANVFGGIQSVAAVTLGEAAEVGGSILAGAAVTVEKDGKVTGDVAAGEAATLGASASVLGDVAAIAEVSTGAQSAISGDVTSSGGIKLGAAARVFGNTTAANSVTLEAYAEVGNDGLASSVRTMSGPIILGAHATVKGDAKAGSIISMGINAKVLGVETQHAVPEDFVNKAESPVAKKTDELTQIQEQLFILESDTELATTIATSRAFYPGVYHASALTTAAGVTLTFIGTGPNNPDHWLINIDTYLSFGANVTIDLVNVGEGSTIIFNSGTYTTIGANSIFRGTIITGTYITTGANSTLSGVGSNCGGLLAINGAITIGAHGTVGAADCWQTTFVDQPDLVDYCVESTATGCGTATPYSLWLPDLE